MYKLIIHTYMFLLTGSKEEAFFDSKPWIDSDCEDDFYSVNGGKHLNFLFVCFFFLLLEDFNLFTCL